VNVREIREHVLLDSATAEATSALAYPVTEAEGVYFWSRLLEQFGLVFLCTPSKSIAPDAYFVKRSMLTDVQRERIAACLEAGQLDPSLLADGIVEGVEFESKASYAKKHFEGEGRAVISLICCIENDWPDVPVPVWALQDHLSIFEEAPVPSPAEPSPAGAVSVDGKPRDLEIPLDQDELDRIQHALRTDGQRLALLAFLHPDARRPETKEGTDLALHAKHIKEYANNIATENDLPIIRFFGGVLTAFTQEGEKKSIGLLRKGRRLSKEGSEYSLKASFLPYIRRIKAQLEWSWTAVDDSQES